VVKIPYDQQIKQVLGNGKKGDLNVGAVLEKKIGPSNRNRFVITHCGYNHYYVTSLKSGERVLVSKHRVREEFDIAH
jgi:hypothetical protein